MNVDKEERDMAVELETLFFKGKFPALCAQKKYKCFKEGQIGVSLESAKKGELCAVSFRDVFFHVSQVEEFCVSKARLREVIASFPDDVCSPRVTGNVKQHLLKELGLVE